MTRDELMNKKRFPRWVVGLMLVGSVFGGVACEGNVNGDVDTENGGENGDGGEGVDGDVDVDTDVEGEGEGD